MSGRARRIVLVCCVVAVAAVMVFVTCSGDSKSSPRAPDPIRPAKVIRRRPATVEPGPAPSAASATYALEGQVIDEDDRPVEGAHVVLQRDPKWPTATSEGDGSFRLAAVPEGDYFVLASKDALTSPPVTIHLGARTEPITLRITRGCDARVHVVAAEDNSPIAGATVSDGLGHSGTTAPDGTTELRGLVCDNIGLRARAPGREMLVLRVDLAHGDIEDVTITLARGATLSGTVIGPDGALVANADVYITTRGRFDFQLPRRVTADANGAWTSDGLAAGSYELEGASDLYTKADPFVIELDGIHDRTGVVVRLETGAQLVGKVLDQRGTPIADALVEIAAEMTRWTTSTRTDATGAFAFLGIPPATYVVSASGFASASTHQRVEAPDHQRVEIELRVADSSIAGTVVDTRGEPLADVDVVAISPDTPSGTFRRSITNGAGHFDLGGVPSGRYRLFARRRDQTDDDGDGVIVHSGDLDVKLVLPGITTITGRVLLDHKPVTYFGVVVSERGEQHWRGAFPVAFRAATGRFTQRGVAAGDRNLVIVGPGFARHILDVRIPEGKQLDLGDIDVDRGQQVSGRVTDASGAPVTNATILVDQIGPRQVLSPPPLIRALQGGALAITDASGSYSLSGIAAPIDPPIERREFNLISASHPDRGKVPPRELGPTESNVDFVLAASGGIDGVIEGPLGSLTYVVVQHDNSSDTNFGLIQNRRFEFDQLAAGNHTLSLARQKGDGFKVPPLTVTVVANQRIPAVFKLPPSVTLAIRVPDDKCQLVMLVPPGTSAPPTEPRSAPGFAFCEGADAIIEGVPPGSYRACMPSGRCAAVTVAPSPARQTFEFPAK